MIIRAIVLLHTQRMAKISRTLQTYVNTKQLFTTITFYNFLQTLILNSKHHFTTTYPNGLYTWKNGSNK